MTLATEAMATETTHTNDVTITFTTCALLRLPFRILILLPFIFMAPEVVQAMVVGNVGVVHLTVSTADVFGTGAIIFLWLMLSVTPVITMTGWSWHRPLRREYGVGLFLCALCDFIIAAAFTADHLKGGFITRIAGHTFLITGTLAFLLAVPLVITASKRAQRWLGPHWKWLHRLTYPLWAAVMLHMLALFGLSGLFISSVLVSIPLVVMRIPPVSKWWAASRRDGTNLELRILYGLPMVIMFAIGFAAFFTEFLNVGFGAMMLHPPG